MSARRTARQLAAHVGPSASSNRVGFDNQVIRRIVQGETRHDVQVRWRITWRPLSRLALGIRASSAAEIFSCLNQHCESVTAHRKEVSNRQLEFKNQMTTLQARPASS
jgi:hypothetical protein